jgi:hypothetical protein
LEHLPDFSFMGKLLVLLANVRLDWKVIARYKHSSLFGLVVVSNEGKKFYNVDTWFTTVTSGSSKSFLAKALPIPLVTNLVSCSLWIAVTS